MKKSISSFDTRWLLGYIAIIVLALLIRLPFFGAIPQGLNRDEAALGYNAYSLLHTGHDEFGQPWPISITSFGDQKLPGYVYTLIPFIALGDLEMWVVRLPSFIAGLVVITSVGWLALQLKGSFVPDERHRRWLSWTAMGLVAVSPWGLHFSHVAYEAHLAMACLVLGLVAYNHALSVTTARAQRLWLWLAAGLWAATLLTYHSYHIFIPLLLMGLLILDYRRILKLDKWGVLGGLTIGVVVVGILAVGGVWQANLVKNNGISPFHRESLRDQATEFRKYMVGENGLPEKLLFNPVTEAGVRLAENIIAVPGTTFLFVTGSGHGDHNPGNVNNLHLFIAPLLLIGLKVGWDNRRQVTISRLLIWTAVGLIPSALTIEPQHTVRFSPVFPVIELWAAIGLLALWLSLKHWRFKYAFLGIVILVIGLSAIRGYLRYNFLIPARVTSNERYHLLAQTIKRYQTPERQVVTQSPNNSPYIWYVFENKYDPARLASHIQRYPADGEGFVHVKQLDNISFETINWDDLFARAQQQELILVFKPSETPIEKRTENRMLLLETIYDVKGVAQYEVWSLKPALWRYQELPPK